MMSTEHPTATNECPESKRGSHQKKAQEMVEAIDCCLQALSATMKVVEKQQNEPFYQEMAAEFAALSADRAIIHNLAQIEDADAFAVGVTEATAQFKQQLAGCQRTHAASDYKRGKDSGYIKATELTLTVLQVLR